jgi:hypothetical protein
MAFDFPSSPAEGQVFTAPSGPTYVFNAPTWRAVGQGQIAIISDTPPASPANGALWYESDSGILFIWYNDGNSSQWVQVGGLVQPPPPRMVQTILTVSGTYTKPADLRYLEVEIMSPGGGGGGAGATPAAQYACGSGGGAGGWGRQLFPAASLPSSVAYVVGAIGVGQSSNNGTPGGTSSFSTLSATGGAPGSAGPNATAGTIQPGVGGIASGGEVTTQGARGTDGNWVAASGMVSSGIGGHSPFGMGGQGWHGTVDGGAATGYGAGGGGGCNIASVGTGRIGGNGAPSFIKLTEYF